MKRKATLVLFCMMMMHATAHAFEMAGGIRSGMAYDEVVRKLQQQGYAVTPEPDPDNARYLGVTARRNNELDHLLFCDGALIGHAYPIAGDFRTFIRLIERMTRQRGVGQYHVDVSDWRDGPHHSLTFSWEDGPNTITVHYAAESVPTTISMTYEVGPSACSKDKRK